MIKKWNIFQLQLYLIMKMKEYLNKFALNKIFNLQLKIIFKIIIHLKLFQYNLL